MLLLIIFLAIAYLLGSLSSAVIVCKAMNLTDPRTEGSQNPGATNVLRVSGNKQAAALTLVADMLKGFLPVILAKLLGVDAFFLGFIGLAAVLGHLFPVFYGFNGGKGVATTLGAFLGLSFFIGSSAIVTWLAIVAISRYSSLAALVAMLVATVLTVFTSPIYFISVAIIVALVIWKHWENISRLKAGEEDKIDLKKFK